MPQISVSSKMLAGKVLVALLVTTTVWSTAQVYNGTCGCPMVKSESFHEGRIPAIITEWTCMQTGAPCGACLERAPISTVSTCIMCLCLFPIYHLSFENSFVNWLGFWMLDTPGILEEWILWCIEGTSLSTPIAFACRLKSGEFNRLRHFLKTFCKKEWSLEIWDWEHCFCI